MIMQVYHRDGPTVKQVSTGAPFIARAPCCIIQHRLKRFRLCPVQGVGTMEKAEWDGHLR